MAADKNIKISPELHAAMLKYCAATGVKIGFLAERAILKYLESLKGASK
jgi:hypothetical protein